MIQITTITAERAETAEHVINPSKLESPAAVVSPDVRPEKNLPRGWPRTGPRRRVRRREP